MRRSLRDPRPPEGRTHPPCHRLRSGCHGDVGGRGGQGASAAAAGRIRRRVSRQGARHQALHPARQNGRDGVGGRGPLPLRPGSGRDRRIPAGRRHAPTALARARRTCARPRRRQGHAFRRLGAQCAARLGRGRLQRVGRATPRHATARRHRRVGDLPARHRRRRRLQVRDPEPGRPAAAQGRPGRLWRAASARDRQRRARHRGLRLVRRRLDDPARSAAPHRRADLGLRGASWKLAAQGRQPPDLLSRGRPRNWSSYAATWASPISSCCRSPNTRSTGPGAISRWACTPPPSASARRTNSAIWSTPPTRPGSA